MKKPIDLIADRLIAKVRTDPSGARSFAHLLVLVPTAQSGRRLRLKLAERLGALVPPTVMMPAMLFETERPGESGPPLATRSDELAALWTAQGPNGSLEIAAQLADVRGILGANALSFADVAARIGNILTGDLADVEIARWRDLAALEARYLAALAARGRADRIAAMKAVIADPPRFAGVEEIVIACVLEPLPAMRAVVEAMRVRDGLTVEEILPDPPKGPLPLRLEQISAEGTPASESEAIAGRFAEVKPDEALPSLCLADPKLFPEIQGALQAKGLKAHDPSRMRLVSSSLGHLAAQIAELVRFRSYDVFSAFVRGGDVRRWLCSELKLTSAQMTAALVDLDNRQAELLPGKIDDIDCKTRKTLRAIFDFVEVQLRKKTLRGILHAIFRDRVLDTRDADAREFAAAAETLNGLIDECFAADIPEALVWELFARRLDEATYSLEPDEGDVVLTDGWLEVPYLDADELLIAGFCEGSVPESVVGHAFLPDALRRTLGLVDNESRTRRDETILRMALACREPQAVHISFHAVDANGDVRKPSRLLFLTDDDGELVRRVRAFYTIRPGTGDVCAGDLPEGWRISLPTPPALRELPSVSPTALDSYRRCPFTYFLKQTFGEPEDFRATELDPSEFGNLAHQALELWGGGDLADSTDATAIAARLGEHVEALLAERFGVEVPAIVALQGESLRRRLANFARAQAVWRQEGWRVRATERKLRVRYDHTELHGRCDRIDFNEKDGRWCVIDYKTWNALPDRAEDGLQLPLYCAMLDADRDFPDATRDRICSCYCIIGKNRESTGYGPLASGAGLPEAERTVRELIARIERGIFWPPAKSGEWISCFQHLIRGTPEESVDPKWIEDQERRLKIEEERKGDIGI